MNKILCAALFMACAMYAQPRATHGVISAKTATTSDVVTIQQSQTTPTAVFPVAAVILSTVNGTVKVEHSGATPTATKVMPFSTISGGSASQAEAFTSSNVGAGTQASVIYNLFAGVPLTLDMTTLAFSGLGTARNISVIVALGSSGNVQTALYWAEGSR